ncbi:uncharacterized protein PAC_04410 [Phialocephala subalpina]|uniref:Uncharacterized protein n=1 Tax=Phialocephala subalpina TaxID=576137 RepID=A0A1L7WP22_9HELO|nr:uncharacterized protein PAC_04410 [Phialocephala subalpina]
MGGEGNQILKLEIEGGIEDIVEIGQQMAWLEATMQHSSGPGLRYAEAEFCSVMPGNGVFDITFHQSPLNENEASCWFSLFTSSVMAKDFPIAARGQEVGLEIPIEMMAALTGVRHAVEYEGGILLKGYSSAFVPVKRYKDSIQWHYIENAEEVRLPYWAVEARCPGRAMLDEMNMESVKNTRAFVGWWITTETHLGTETANYENIDWSAAGQVGRAITFSGATLGFQQIMTGEVNFSLGARDGKLYVERKGPYQKIVQCAARSPVVLYDTCEKRAWLVPASGVILHIARTRNHQNPFMIDGKEINFPSADPSMSSHEPAEKVLLSQASFKLCAEDDLGNKDYYLGDLVRDIWSYMESLLDKNVTKEVTSDPEVRGTMRHLLRGWEFMDLVYDRSPFLLKETYIEKSSGGWTNLARDIDAVVLFGSWFEGIKLNEKFMAGLCHVWKSVPKGKDYLTASVPVMNWLYKVAGSKLSRKHLTSTHLRWHKGGQLWERCDSTKLFSCNCIRLQQVVSDGFAHVGSVSDPGLLEEKGAVIFGQASDPLSSTVLDLLKPKVQQSGNLYSQPNVDLLETDTFSSPDSSLSSDTGMSSISSISVSTLPTSDEDDPDLKADGPCRSRGGTVKPNGNDKKRRFSHSLELSYFEEDVESVQHPNRRSRKQCSKERQDFGVHSEYAHSGPSNKLAERSGLLVEDVVGDGKRLSLRRKRNFIKQVGC